MEISNNGWKTTLTQIFIMPKELRCAEPPVEYLIILKKSDLTIKKYYSKDNDLIFREECIYDDLLRRDRYYYL